VVLTIVLVKKMTTYSFDLEEKDLDEYNFCTGATAHKIDGILHYDAVGALAAANGLDMDPASKPHEKVSIINFAKFLANHHQVKHGEDIAVSFDDWIKKGKNALEWFRSKGYIK
jgi:hypothetical protein